MISLTLSPRIIPAVPLHSSVTFALVKMKKHIRDEIITKEMHRIWPSFTIEPDGFRTLFKSVTYDYGYYRKKFADEMLKRIDGNGDLIYDTEYIQHRILLADWWGNELTRMSNLSAPQPRALPSSSSTAGLLPTTTLNLFRPCSHPLPPNKWGGK